MACQESHPAVCPSFAGFSWLNRWPQLEALTAQLDIKGFSMTSTYLQYFVHMYTAINRMNCTRRGYETLYFVLHDSDRLPVAILNTCGNL